MNTLIVTTEHTVTVPGVASKTLKVGEKVAPSSPFYWVVLWSGYGSDSGNQSVVDDERAYLPNLVVASEEDPQLGPGGVWIQLFPNGDYTMWIEE